LRRLLQPGLATESWVSTGADAVRQGLGSALTRLSIRVELDNKTAQDEVQEALAICGGDAIAALRITLIANAFLEAEVDRLSAAVSSGFARGKVRKAPTSKKAKENKTH
jgi:hypothetical protein